MQITVTITDKVIKQAIDNALDGSVYDYFDSAILKAAKIPKVKTAVDTVFKDPKFQASLTKHLQAVAESAMEDEIYDAMYDLDLPGLDDMIKSCEAAYEAREELAQEKKDAEEVKRMVRALERAGYKMVKA